MTAARAFKLFKKFIRESLAKAEKALFHYGKVNYKGQGLIHFIDVGAIGELPDPWFKNARYVRKLLRFEPQESQSVHPDVITFDCALGSRNETRPFHIYQGNLSHGSSFFEQNTEYVDANWETLKTKGPARLAATWHERGKLIRTIQIECRTLDAVLRELNLDFTFDFIKIDTQGAEFEILSGSEDFLRNDCLGLQLELYTVPVYKGIRLKDEVTVFLAERGFDLVKEYTPFGTFDCAHDGVYLRRETPPGKEEKMALIKRVYGI